MRILICDVCRLGDRPAHTYTVESGGRKGTTERCDEHAAVFEIVIEGKDPALPVLQPGEKTAPTKTAPAKAATTPKAKTPKVQKVAVETGATPTRRRSKGVTTMEEIENLKKA